MPRRIALVTISLLGALTAGAVLMTPSPGSAGSTIAVNMTADAPDAGPLDGVCDSDLEVPGEQCTLRAAVQHANVTDGADTIEVPAGTYILSIPINNRLTGAGGGGPVDSGANGDLDITTDMTIVGEGALATVVDANAIDRAIEIQPPGAGAFHVTITGVGITGGNASDTTGGAIDAEAGSASTLEISDVTLGENDAQLGGGINIGSNVTANITRSIIAGNSATSDGGGVRVTGNAVVTIDHSQVSGNTAESSGGIANLNNEAHLTVRYSTISGNTVPTYGGGVFGGCCSEQNITTIEHSTISGNEAGDGGGGIYQAGGVLEIDNSTISGNHALNNSDQGGGGLMQDWDGPITVTNSTIANNTSDARGDGIYLQDEGPVTFRNTIIADNGTTNCQKFPGTGVLISDGYNLVSDNDCGLNSEGDRVGAANLEVLANYGGPTETHSLAAGSEAIDNGDPDNCPDNDQRGFLRPGGSGCDIGAFEAGAAEPTPTPEPGDERTFGDVTCNGPADSVDALSIQRNLAALPVNQTQPCPGIGETVDIQGASEHLWGDVDCDDDVDTVDSLKLLRFVAGLSVQQEPGCPAIGSEVLVTILRRH